MKPKGYLEALLFSVEQKDGDAMEIEYLAHPVLSQDFESESCYDRPPILLFHTALNLFELGHFEEALAEITAAIKFDKTNPLFFELEGHILYELEAYIEALESFYNAATLSHDFVFQMEMWKQFHLCRNTVHKSRGDQDLADKDFDEAINITDHIHWYRNPITTKSSLLKKLHGSENISVSEDMDGSSEIVTSQKQQRPIIFVKSDKIGQA